jgi:hypothetical protein
MQTATILLNRAAMNAPIMSSVDGALKALLWDGRMVPGASTTEFELAERVDTYGRGRVCISYYTLQAQGGATPRDIPNLHIMLRVTVTFS